MTLLLSRRQLIGLGAACGAAACLPDTRFKHRNTVIPERLDDGWEIDSPTSVGLDPAALQQVHDELLREDRHLGALAMLIIKEGKLVWETYLHGRRDRGRHHATQSVTKSVTSLAFGMARDDGHFPDLEATLDSFIPHELTGAARDKAEITLDQLLTMRSGIAFDNHEFALEMLIEKPSRPLHHMLSKPLCAAPGERYYYRDTDPQIIGYLLQQELGRSEEAWVQERLFAALGIRDYLWESGRDGVSMAAFGLHLRPRDLGKLGQLLLEHGSFAGRSLVSPEWCDKATRAVVSSGNDGTQHAALGYGYYFWTVDDSRQYMAWGRGGQAIFVAPEQNMVCVKIALPNVELHGATQEDFLELMAPLLA